MWQGDRALNIRQLLDADCEHFIPFAYVTLLNRRPDPIGLIHYTYRLHNGASRELVIAEILNSQEYARLDAACWTSGSKKLLKAYKRLRAIPLGKMKWSLLPSFGHKHAKKTSFDWVEWASEFILNDDLIVDGIKDLYKGILDVEADEETLYKARVQVKKGSLLELFLNIIDISEYKRYCSNDMGALVLPNDSPRNFLYREQINMHNFTKAIGDRPDLYVVIPSFEDSIFLNKCIISLQKHGQHLVTKIIISDDCSTTAEHSNYLSHLKSKNHNYKIPIDVVLSDINTGFSANVNRGLLKVPSNADVLLLNSDTEITEHSISALYATGRQNGGVAGARLLYPDMKIQHGGGFRNFNAPEWFEHRYRMRDRFHPPALTSYNALYCTAAALYIPWETRRDVGVFDEKFSMGFEDVDYCLRVWKCGLPVNYVGSSEIIHYESVTRGKQLGEREDSSKKYFWLKYDSFFTRKVTDDNGRIKVIFVTKDTGVGGGHRVIYRFAGYLASLSEQFAVEIWCLDTKPDWFELNHFVNFRTYNSFNSLENDLKHEDAIKIATWWETAEYVWRSSLFAGLPVWLSLDIESSYYKGRDTFNEMRALASYAPEFIYIACYKWLAAHLVEKFYFNSNYVGLGVDKETFNRTFLPRRKRSILICARGEPLKGYPLSRDIIKKLSEFDFNITVYGNDIALVPSAHNISFIYKPDNHDLCRLYNTHEFFLQTSIHEGLSLPPLEAMSCGCIPVVTEAFGNCEYIKDGYNSIVIPRNVDAAVDAITQSTYDDIYPTLEHGMSITLGLYDWSKSFEAFRQLLTKISHEPIYGKTKF